MRIKRLFVFLTSFSSGNSFGMGGLSVNCFVSAVLAVSAVVRGSVISDGAQWPDNSLQGGLKMEFGVTHNMEEEQIKYEEVKQGHVIVKDGESLHLRCIFSGSTNTNGSLVWRVQTHAWNEESAWMDSQKIVMDMEDDDPSYYDSNNLVTSLHINATDAKDVGNYGCSLADPESLDIDEDDLVLSVHVYVKGGELSSRDTGQVVLLSSDNDVVFLPCTPSFPQVVVTVSASGVDVTEKFKYSPTVGFTARSPFTSTSFTCYFKYKDDTESLHLTQNGMSQDSPWFSVTFNPGETTLEQGEQAHFSCKTTADLQVDFHWSVPALGSEVWLQKEDDSLFHRDRLKITEVTVEGVIISTLEIFEVFSSDEGVYKCMAERIDGEVTSAEMFINVAGVEGVEEDITEIPGGNHFMSDQADGNTANDSNFYILSKRLMLIACLCLKIFKI